MRGVYFNSVGFVLCFPRLRLRDLVHIEWYVLSCLECMVTSPMVLASEPYLLIVSCVGAAMCAASIVPMSLIGHISFSTAACVRAILVQHLSWDVRGEW